MLPSQFLRITTNNKGKNIFPIFLTVQKDLSLTTEIIKIVESSIKNKEKKSVIRNKILELEKKLNVDHKLVQGLYELINRRCKYIEYSDILNDNDICVNNLIQCKDPILLRKLVFEESSRNGLAITIDDRRKILEKIAVKLKTPINIIEKLLWIDLEENQIIRSYDQITPEELTGWYNLSILQTLFFNCTSIEISLQGGTNWKKVLRLVKKFGLMYTLKEVPKKISEENKNFIKNEHHYIDSHSQIEDTSIICLIDGPLSIFKMHEKYGTAIAKIIPSIVMLDRWRINASIIRKTISASKICEFCISNYESILFMFPSNKFKKENLMEINESLFDSKVEEIFAKKFELFNRGWELIREPDPLILTDNRAFIPDFLIRKYDIQIYVEIIGFWTDEYLKRKLNKITDILNQKKDKIEFFFLINQDSSVAKYSIQNTIKEIEKINSHNFIYYKNSNITIKPIIDHLKSLDEIMITKITESEKERIIEIIEEGLNHSKTDVISLKEISKKYDFSMESINHSINLYQKNCSNSFYKIDEFLISTKKLNLIKEQLKNIIKLEEALKILKYNNIPEACWIQIIQILGYNILWNGIDVYNATIFKK